MTPFAYRRNFKAPLAFILAFLTVACAAIQPPDPTGPESGGLPYPVVLTELSQRTEASALALRRLAPAIGGADQIEVYLQPITATIKSLPTKLATPLYLPRVGGNPEMNEEETREALRRFISDWGNLIGASPLQLSLVERIDQPNRTRIAKYVQRPFRYPLRGDFGKLEIHFTADRRLLNLSSSCIPDAERLQASLAGATPRVEVEAAVKRVREQPITYTDSSGNQQAYQLAPNNEVKASELVTYVLPSTALANSLKLHIAWEVLVINAPFKTVYVDAFKDEIIAVR